MLHNVVTLRPVGMTRQSIESGCDLMPRRGNRWAACLLLLPAMALAACGGSPNGSAAAQPDGPPPPGIASLSVAATAADLAAPATALTGIWSVAAHLHIGVYTTAGKELLHGAQPIGDHNLFLYRFELGPLASQTANAPDTWNNFATRLAASPAASKLSGDQLRTAFTAFLGQSPPPYSTQLLSAMKVDVMGAGALTSFDEWLLLVDGEILHGALTALQQASMIRPLGAPAGQPTALLMDLAPVTLDQYLAVVDGIAMAGILTVDMSISNISINMGWPGPGDISTVTATFDIQRPVASVSGILTGRFQKFVCTYSQFTVGAGLDVQWSSTDGDDVYQTPIGGSDQTTSAGSATHVIQANRDFTPSGTRKSAVVGFSARLSPTALNALEPRCVGLYRAVSYLEHAAIGYLNVHYHQIPAYMVGLSSEMDCPTLRGRATISLHGEVKPASTSPTTLNGGVAGTMVVTGALGSDSIPLQFPMDGTVTKNGIQLSSPAFAIGTGAFDLPTWLSPAGETTTIKLPSFPPCNGTLADYTIVLTPES